MTANTVYWIFIELITSFDRVKDLREWEYVKHFTGMEQIDYSE